MNEIAIGEYVRDKDGIIEKVEQIGNSLFWIEDGLAISLYDKDIKHSKNIKDLIEVGDYVNGYRIDNIINNILVHRGVGIDRSGFMIPVAQYNDDIKTVVTKEQLKKISYKVDS